MNEKEKRRNEKDERKQRWMESSPVVNVIWGWVNFVVAGLILFYANVHPHLLRAFG